MHSNRPNDPLVAPTQTTPSHSPQLQYSNQPQSPPLMVNPPMPQVPPVNIPMPQGAAQQQIYHQLQTWAQQVLLLLLGHESVDLSHTLTQMLLQTSWDEIVHQGVMHLPDVLKGKVLEALSMYIKHKTRALDDLIPAVCIHNNNFQVQQQRFSELLQEAARRDRAKITAGDFLFAFFVELASANSSNLGNLISTTGGTQFTGDLNALGSILSGLVIGSLGPQANNPQGNLQDLAEMIGHPATLLSFMICNLQELQGKITRIAMELYNRSRYLDPDAAKNRLMSYYSFYTVETTTGTVNVHQSGLDEALLASDFRIQLIDTFGALLQLLQTMESTSKKVIAMDFEGMKLCRHGALCLIQVCLQDDPHMVYVIDTFLLGRRCFSVATKNETSLKTILEDENYTKVWFDPRNDVDALYHQFGVFPKGIFDLQLAEVADRRARGLNVQYVQGLGKVLWNCPKLTTEQKKFADRINLLGKNLFEPQNGGNYEIFQHRPLNPVILVYAAHDARHMLTLYDTLLANLPNQDVWIPRILVAGNARAQWAFQDYVVPSSEAPEI